MWEKGVYLLQAPIGIGGLRLNNDIRPSDGTEIPGRIALELDCENG